MSEDVVSPFDEVELKRRLMDSKLEKLKFYREQARFFKQSLTITMVSGKQYATVQHLNTLALKKPLLIAMQKQGFINVNAETQINPQHIESIKVSTITDEAELIHIPSEGIGYLIKQGYTADGCILSENMMAKALDYTKRHTLYEDDDL